MVKVLRRIILFLFFWQILASALPLPKNLIGFNSATGKLLLSRSLGQDYLQLSMQFVTQRNQAYCGIASMTMALNALNVEGPPDPIYSPFRPITQDNFFSDKKLTSVISPTLVAQQGLTLDQAAELASQYPVVARALHSNTLSLNSMRSVLIGVVNHPQQFAIINFYRPGLQEVGGGHFSPIAAYDIKTDRFLILDVARYKYPPVWAASRDIWKAINTVDATSQKSRGILIVESPKFNLPHLAK